MSFFLCTRSFTASYVVAIYPWLRISGDEIQMNRNKEMLGGTPIPVHILQKEVDEFCHRFQGESRVRLDRLEK